MSILNTVLRTLASVLQAPVIVLLLLLVFVTVVLVGVVIGEYFTEHRCLKVEFPKLVDEINQKEDEIESCILESGLLRRQKNALIELTRHPDLSDVMRESMAVRLLQAEEEVYEKRVKISDMIGKLGPILGLLGTLIPLGPGIIALSQGDTATLSASLLTAFDTTIAGLVAAGVAMIISGIRNGWYESYMSTLEALMECILEIEKRR